MTKKDRLEVHSYSFAGFKLIAKKHESRFRWIWVMICQDCAQELPVKKLGECYWVAICRDCKIEYTITPNEIFKAVETNTERVM